MNNKEDVQNLLAAMSVSGVIGLVVGIMRGVIQQKHGSLSAFFRGVLASLFVAVIVSWGLADTGLSVTAKGTITGICSFIADDILLGLLSLASLMGKDPIGFLTRLTAAYRGQASEEQKKDD
jgi:uncharacterized membrane protein required for colicin V production